MRKNSGESSEEELIGMGLLFKVAANLVDEGKGSRGWTFWREERLVSEEIVKLALQRGRSYIRRSLHESKIILILG